MANRYSEALFRTLKHTPAYPRLPFADLASANGWVARFVDWYNGMRRHSAIRYVTPDQRHHGCEGAVLASETDCTNACAEPTPSAGAAPPATGCLSGRSCLNPIGHWRDNYLTLTTGMNCYPCPERTTHRVHCSDRGECRLRAVACVALRKHAVHALLAQIDAGNSTPVGFPRGAFGVDVCRARPAHAS
jgi:hypothetical protein